MLRMPLRPPSPPFLYRAALPGGNAASTDASAAVARPTAAGVSNTAGKQYGKTVLKGTSSSNRSSQDCIGKATVGCAQDLKKTPLAVPREHSVRVCVHVHVCVSCACVCCQQVFSKLSLLHQLLEHLLLVQQDEGLDALLDAALHHLVQVVVNLGPVVCIHVVCGRQGDTQQSTTASAVPHKQA